MYAHVLFSLELVLFLEICILWILYMWISRVMEIWNSTNLKYWKYGIPEFQDSWIILKSVIPLYLEFCYLCYGITFIIICSINKFMLFDVKCFLHFTLLSMITGTYSLRRHSLYSNWVIYVQTGKPLDLLLYHGSQKSSWLMTLHLLCQQWLLNLNLFSLIVSDRVGVSPYNCLGGNISKSHSGWHITWI